MGAGELSEGLWNCFGVLRLEILQPLVVEINEENLLLLG
jgi:hypothetical protein